MKTLALLFVLFISGTLFAQEYPEQVLVIQSSGRYFTYGDLTFTKDYQGIRLFMENLKSEDKAAYQQMQPIYTTLQQDRATSIGIMVGGGILGTGLFIHGTAQLLNDTGELGAKPQYTSFIASIFVLGGSLGLSRLIYSPERKLLEFVNAFNRETEGLKLQLTGGRSWAEDGMGDWQCNGSSRKIYEVLKPVPYREKEP